MVFLIDGFQGGGGGGGGGRLSIKMPSYQYRDSHVKHKKVSPTVLSLTWEFPYMGKTVFILRQDSWHLFTKRTSYRNISWSLYKLQDYFQRSEAWQVPRQQRCRDACQVSERYDRYTSTMIDARHQRWKLRPWQLKKKNSMERAMKE